MINSSDAVIVQVEVDPHRDYYKRKYKNSHLVYAVTYEQYRYRTWDVRRNAYFEVISIIFVETLKSTFNPLGFNVFNIKIHFNSRFFKSINRSHPFFVGEYDPVT